MSRHHTGQQFPADYIGDLQAAAQRIVSMTKEAFGSIETPVPFAWLKLAPAYPAFCDQAFAFKNQVVAYLIDRVDEAGNSSITEESKARLLAVASQNNLIPCRFAVKEGHLPVEDGWNLVRLDNGQAVNPMEMASDGPVERSNWERMEIAVETTAAWLAENRAGTMTAVCTIPGADPQIWFHDNTGGDSWILVREKDEPDFDEKAFFQEHPTLKSCAGYRCVVNLGEGECLRGHAVDPRTEGPVKIHLASDGSLIDEEAPLGSKPLCADAPSDEKEVSGKGCLLYIIATIAGLGALAGVTAWIC